MVCVWQMFMWNEIWEYSKMFITSKVISFKEFFLHKKFWVRNEINCSKISEMSHETLGDECSSRSRMLQVVWRRLSVNYQSRLEIILLTIFIDYRSVVHKEFLSTGQSIRNTRVSWSVSTIQSEKTAKFVGKQFLCQKTQLTSSRKCRFAWSSVRLFPVFQTETSTAGTPRWVCWGDKQNSLHELEVIAKIEFQGWRMKKNMGISVVLQAIGITSRVIKMISMNNCVLFDLS